MRKLYKARWFRAAAILFALAMAAIPVTPAFASTTADVTVTATPEYIAISVAPTTYDFGVVATSSNTTTDNTSHFTITNTSSVTTNMTISVTTTNWTGGTQWISSDAGAVGANTAVLYANAGGTFGTSDVLVKNGSPNKIKTNQGATTNFYFGLDLLAPTSFSDGVQKQIVVRVTASVP